MLAERRSLKNMDRIHRGLGDAARCPKCGRDLEPEFFEVDGQRHVAFRCPRHGIEAIGDDSDLDDHDSGGESEDGSEI